MEEVIEDIRSKLNPSPLNFLHFVVGEDKERLIWNEMDQYPSGRGKRLVIIRNAEALKNFSRLESFIKNRSANPRTYVVFVSGEARLPRLAPTEEEKRERKLPAYVPHLLLFGSTRGYLIECRPYTNDTAKHAITWVKSKINIRDGIAAHLLERANGDLRLVRDTCRKLRAFDGVIHLSTINMLLSERPRDDFADALLRMDKRTAHLALERLAPTEYSRTIGFLDARLELAGIVHDMMTAHKTQAEISSAVGSQRFLVPEVMEVAKHYDVKRRTQIRTALALADTALQQGQTIGVLEMVIQYW